MGIPWEKVVTDPLGFASYGLALVFGIVSFIVRQRKPKDRWVVPVAIALAAVCVLGGLSLAYLREVAGTQNTNVPAPSMHIDKLKQKVGNGAAVAGVQGNVNISPSSPQGPPKPKQ
jgi:hypothetical protein